MSTNAYLVRHITDKAFSVKLEGIYVHFDGQPSSMMPLLSEHYTDKEKVDKLFSLGSASFIAPNLEPEGNPSNHSFKAPLPGVSVFYCRDRNQELMKILFDSEIDCINVSRKHHVTFIYIFKEGKWSLL